MNPIAAQKVVIVEDNASLSDIYKTRLEIIGYTCFAAYDGQTALEIIEREKPDLVLLDLMVPKVAGDQILATMRSHDWGKDIKVLVISNLNEADAPAGIRQQGIEGYVVKANLSNDQLDELVDNILKPSGQTESVDLEGPEVTMQHTDTVAAPAVSDLMVTRIFNLDAATLWRAWTDTNLLKQWWGPDNFTCPSAELNVYPGGLSIVEMTAPTEMGGQTFYSSWAYTGIKEAEKLEFIHNLCDQQGSRVEPTSIGMPADFPQGQRQVVNFKALSPAQTEVTVIQYGWPAGQMCDMAELGLQQSLAKLAALNLVTD